MISPERRINENSGGLRDDIYTSYQVESVNKDNIHRVWRRYNQFLLLVRLTYHLHMPTYGSNAQFSMHSNAYHAVRRYI